MEKNFKTSISALIKAKIQARLAGFHPLVLLFGSFSIILIFGSLACINYFKLDEAKISFYFGIVLMFFSLLSALFFQKSHPSGIPAEINVSDGKTSVGMRFPYRSPVEMVALLRECIQHQKALPDPHGTVVAGNPKDSSNLREYSDSERKKVGEEIEKGRVQYNLNIQEILKPFQDSLINSEGSHPDTLEGPEKSHGTTE